MYTLARKKFTVHIVANLLIIAVIAMLALGASGAATEVFSQSYNAIYSGKGPGVCLMINVYSGTEYIIPILDELDRYGVKATFFIGGTWAEKNVETLIVISERGHELGNHGYLHRDHKNLSLADNRAEIIITSKLIYTVTGKTITLFAPPSGSMGNNMAAVCEELNYKVIMWSKDTIDWRDQDAALIYTRATKNVKAGDFILMHPTAATLQALPAILAELKKQGIPAVTVSENLPESGV